mgnify:CR=1 FL=1
MLTGLSLLGCLGVWFVYASRCCFSPVLFSSCCSCLIRLLLAVDHGCLPSCTSVLGLYVYFIANNSDLSAGVVLCGCCSAAQALLTAACAQLCSLVVLCCTAVCTLQMRCKHSFRCTLVICGQHARSVSRPRAKYTLCITEGDQTISVSHTTDAERSLRMACVLAGSECLG